LVGIFIHPPQRLNPFSFFFFSFSSDPCTIPSLFHSLCHPLSNRILLTWCGSLSLSDLGLIFFWILFRRFPFFSLSLYRFATMSTRSSKPSSRPFLRIVLDNPFSLLSLESAAQTPAVPTPPPQVITIAAAAAAAAAAPAAVEVPLIIKPCRCGVGYTLKSPPCRIEHHFVSRTKPDENGRDWEAWLEFTYLHRNG
jgi:hypothetical protein